MGAVGGSPSAAHRAVAVALVLTGAAAAAAGQPARSEYEIKAAYLFTFGRFVEWPAGREGGTFTICVLGEDPFGAALEATVAGETLRGRTVATRRVASPVEAAACHVLFISASEDARLGAIVGALSGASVLTVSDIPRFVGRGGMIEFQTAGNRVRFQIDLDPAREARLMLSSDLLRVATAVRGEARPGD